MNIGIDCGALGVKEQRLKTGIFKVTTNLIEGLKFLDKNNNYWLYSFDKIDQKFASSTKFISKKILPKFGWLNFRLSLEMFLKCPDIFLGLNQALPLYLPSKSLLFIYDLAYEHYPKFYQDSYLRMRFLTKRSAAMASKIITFSSAVKSDLINRYNIKAEKIKISKLGVSSDFYPRELQEIEILKKKYNLSKPYIFFCGSLKPMKNITGIISTYFKLPESYKLKYDLVLAGSDFWLDKKNDNLNNKILKENRIKYLGFVPDKDLPALYSGAEVFFSPSFYEGFGLPLLEAMSCGCPVISGKFGSPLEVCGNAVFQVDPDNKEEVFRKLMLVLTDFRIRNELKHKSFFQSKKFNWRILIKDVYNEIINEY